MVLSRRCILSMETVFLLLVGIVSSAELSKELSSHISIKVADSPIPIWSSLKAWRDCHLIDIPDIPTRAFKIPEGHHNNNSDSKTAIRMMNGAVGYHEMHGPTLFNQTRSCKIAWNATLDPNPSMFAGNEFLDSTVRFDNGTVVSLIHTEFPGDTYNACNTSRPIIGSQTRRKTLKRYSRRKNSSLSYPKCWTVSIGLAVSYDFGNTWEHIARPPNHLVAAVPYGYDESRLAYGWGDPSNIVRSPNCSSVKSTTNGVKRGDSHLQTQNTDDCFYYVTLWNRNKVGEQPPGICIARTNQLLDPKSWRAWNGTHYSTQFANPYAHHTNGSDPKEHICTPIEFPGLPSVEECNVSGLLWSQYLRQFVSTIGCFSGVSFYFSTSPDLNHWSPVKEFYNRDKDLPQNVATKTTRLLYPTLLDPHGGNNYDTIGKRPFLFWSSIGHSPYKDGRFLWATPVEFEVDDDAIYQVL